MATYHLTVNVGEKGKAAAHAEYITREGKYQGKNRYEDLEVAAAGNMPSWAIHNPSYFWQASDEHERANGSTYREIEVALPREFTQAQRRTLVEDFIQQELGIHHAYQWAIHTPKAALEKGEQPHAHIMYSERKQDSLLRDPDHYFKRYNAKHPARGGCQKASGGKTPAERKIELLAQRQRWADVQNAHLERHGHAVRVDHRSLKDQGIDHAPEKHLGGAQVRKLTEQNIYALLERRAGEGEHEHAKRDISHTLDLSKELATAQAEKERQFLEKIKQEAAAGMAAVREEFLRQKEIEAGKQKALADFLREKAEQEVQRQAELARQQREVQRTLDNPKDTPKKIDAQPQPSRHRGRGFER